MPRKAVIFVVVAAVLVLGAGLLQGRQAMLFTLVGIVSVGFLLLVVARTAGKRR